MDTGEVMAKYGLSSEEWDAMPAHAQRCLRDMAIDARGVRDWLFSVYDGDIDSLDSIRSRCGELAAALDITEELMRERSEEG